MTKIADNTPFADDAVNQQVLHPGSRALFRYWETLRAERACPSRSDLVLKDIAKLVPNLFIWEKDHIRDTFVYKLSGTAVDYLNCRTMTGADVLTGWDNFEREVMMRVFRVAHEKLHPGLVRMRLFTNYKEAVGAEMLLLPITSRDGRSIEILGGTFCFTDFDRLALNQIVSRQLVTSRVIWTEHQNDNLPSDILHPYPAPAVPPQQSPLRVIQGGRAD